MRIHVVWRWIVVVASVAVAAASPAPMPSQPQPPPSVERLRVEVLASYPHDTDAFTQGLALHDGVLYESTGRYGRSQLRTVEIETGEVRDRVRLPESVFGEGIAVVGGRIWQLTYRAEFAFLRDRTTLAEIKQVDYDGQGWGLCYDPVHDRLVMSDGEPRLTFRDPKTFERLGSVTVTLHGAPLERINELECVDGKVWANVWQTDRIVRIDPHTGRVDTVVNASGLLSPSEQADAGVLNGIAAVEDTDTFLITGKLWPRMFRVRFVEAPSPSDR